MLLALDTEVPGLDLRRGLKPFMVTSCDESGNARCWEWPVNPKTRKVDINQIEVADLRDYIAENETIFHHAQFDLCAFANIGLRLSFDNWIVPESKYATKSYVVPVVRVHDTMFGSHLADSRGVYKSGGKSGARSTHALKELCQVRLNVSDLDEVALKKAVNSARGIADKLGWTKGEKPSHDYWLPKAVHDYWLESEPGELRDISSVIFSWESICRTYAMRDVHERTMMLFLTLRRLLQSDSRWEMYLEELANIPMIYMIEENGVRIHSDRVKKLLISCHDVASSIKTQLQKLAGDKDFNPNSTLQMNKLLFEKWGLPKTAKTRQSGLYTVNAKSLQALQKIATGKALEFLNLLVGYITYDDEQNEILIPGMRNHLKTAQYLTSYERERIGDYVHPTVHAVGTGTTRWSMSGFNGQNVGKKSYGKLVVE